MKLRLLSLLVAPFWLAFALLVLALSPALAAAARFAGRLNGGRAPAAMARLLCVYVNGELSVVQAAARMWLTSGFGARLRSEPYPERHYALMAGLLDDVVVTAMHGLDLGLHVEADAPAAAALASDRPLLVFSRHAGPGDSILLLHVLTRRFGRRPRVVLKELIGLDPAVGIFARRLPHVLIDATPDEARDEIRSLARGLDPRAALLLFPEGGNFTAERRLAAIRWLQRHGLHVRAARAEALEHMISPRPGGALAALEGAPGVDVVFAAHTGLGEAAKGLRILRELPREGTVRMRLWLAPAADRPGDEAGLTDWLDAWWARMDAWVHTPAGG